MPRMTISGVDAYATLEKVVSRSGEQQGKLSTPSAWVGKKVLMILLDPIDEKEK